MMATQRARNTKRVPGMVASRRSAMVEVDNPYFDPASPAGPKNPRKLVAQRFTENTPLIAIRDRGRLVGRGEHESAADRRFKAGERLRDIFEKAEIGGAKAIDYSAVKVDVSFTHPELSPSTERAIAQLTLIRKAMDRHFVILEAIVCHEIPFLIYAKRAAGRETSGTERLEMYQDFRDALDHLADYFNPPNRRERATIAVERRMAEESTA